MSTATPFIWFLVPSVWYLVASCWYITAMNYRELDVYKRSYRLALEIHKFSLGLPQYLQFDICDQIRRASRSIPSNIAEGYARAKSSKDTRNLLNDALGSNEEMLFNLDFLKDVGKINKNLYLKWFNEYTIKGKQLFRLIESLKK